ncbi:hypothetical protein [Algoriphagus terrigena]|uniref:hypothetical protein n=1 Tax=Algoriphagus terrigena TaxID=344884 RepID=UPI0012FAC2CE|nr:hypothetical protein [Algoriphagus terrigena]
MKNFFCSVVFLGMATFSCSDDPGADPVVGCDVDNIFELPWIAERIEDLENSKIGREFSYLHSGQYGSQTVFIFGSCCHYCSMASPSVYDCNGNELGRLAGDGIEWDIKDSQLIWKSSENSCNI